MTPGGRAWFSSVLLIAALALITIDYRDGAAGSGPPAGTSGT